MQRAHWDDDVSVLSSENVFFEIETAGLAARFGAVLIDMTLQIFVILLISLAGVAFSTYIFPVETWALWMINTGEAVFYLLLFLVSYAYYFFFEWLWNGQTPGKRALRLRVMQTNGMPITYWHALVRNVIRIADFLPFMYGVGAIVGILDNSNRRAGDLIAGTIVARERGDLATRKVLDIQTAVEQFLASSLPVDAVPDWLSSKKASTPATPSTPVIAPNVESSADAEVAAMLRKLNAQDYELARDFLIRREKLPAAARSRLAQSLAVRFSARLGQSTPPAAQQEEFLNEIVTRLRGRF